MHKPSVWLRAVLFVEGGFERVGRWMRLLVHPSESRPRAAALLAALAGLIAVAGLVIAGLYWTATHHYPGFWATLFIGLKALKFIGIGVALAGLALARGRLLQFAFFRRLRDRLIGTRDAINRAVAPAAPTLQNPHLFARNAGEAPVKQR